MSDPAPRQGIRISLASIFVQDQAAAERFYTETLGFETKTDIDLGPYRWLTVASPAGADGVELLLEPNAHAAASSFQEAIRGEGMPAMILFTDDVKREYDRLKGLGVEFTMEPTPAGDSMMAIFDDTCGNLIQLHQG